MKRVLIALALVCVLIVLVPSTALAGTSKTTGFDQFGYNYGAYLFNGWYGYYDKDISSGTEDAMLLMKWSKDWIPQTDEPVGAWCTNHFTWYTNDIDEATWYGWYNRVEWTDKDITPEVRYKVTEFLKIMKVRDDPEAWSQYEAGGAYSAGWGDYANGVPKYVVFQDVITITDSQNWDIAESWVANFNYNGAYASSYDINLTTATAGYPAGYSSYAYTWSGINYSVTGNTFSLTATYDACADSLAAGCITHMVGTIAADGSISGDWDDNYPNNNTSSYRSGTWSTAAGVATNTITTISINLCTTSPKGLGKPIF